MAYSIFCKVYNYHGILFGAFREQLVSFTDDF